MTRRKYWSSTAWKIARSSSCSAAWTNNVIDDRSFCASMPPSTAHRIGAGERGQGEGALEQARAEHRVRQVVARLGDPAERIQLRHLAASESGDLGEDEPHPVTALAPGAQLLEGAVVDGARVLGGGESAEVVRHNPMLPHPRAGVFEGLTR